MPAAFPPGCLALICDAEGARLTGYSEMVARDFARDGDAVGLIGLSLRELVGAGAAHALRNALARALEAPRPVLLPGLALGDGRAMDATVSAGENFCCFALEPAAPADPGALDRLRAVADRMGRLSGRARVLAQATRLLAVLGPWDAAIAAVDGDVAWHGKTDGLTERRAADLLATFQDVPVALLADVRAPAQPMIGAAPEILRDARRVAAPGQSALARRLGFAATMRLPLRRGDREIGALLALHRSARPISLAERGFFELFADLCALTLSAETA